MIDGNHPWICPACGHFIVRADRIDCRFCATGPPMVAYTGSEQAIAIRTRSNCGSVISDERIPALTRLDALTQGVWCGHG